MPRRRRSTTLPTTNVTGQAGDPASPVAQAAELAEIAAQSYTPDPLPGIPAVVAPGAEAAVGAEPASATPGEGLLPGVIAAPPDPHDGQAQAAAVLKARGRRNSRKAPRTPPVGGGQV